MSPSEPSPGGLAAALARAAREQPEAPFLFYRDARGQFRWWSFATAAAYRDLGGLTSEKRSLKGVVVEPAAVELLGGFLDRVLGEGADRAGAAPIPEPEPAAVRDVWISWRSLADPAELAIARWTILTGAATLVEPAPALHPELFAWARPTIASGSVAELLDLAGQLESLAPRFLRGRWLRQRGDRLRLLLVSERTAADDVARLAARWRALSLSFAPRILPFAPDTLV